MNIANGYLTYYLSLKKEQIVQNITNFMSRYIGRVSELLLDVWVNTNNVKYKEVKVLDIEPVNWLKKGMLFINSKFRGKKYEKSL